MSFQDILIHRDIPIVAGWLQNIPNREANKTKWDGDSAAVESSPNGSEIIGLSMGSGQDIGSGFGQQRWLRLAGVAPGAWYTTNPADDVEALATGSVQDLT